MSSRTSVVGLVLALAGTAVAGTHRVGPGEAFSTIQGAINASANGDTVLVEPGVYAETPVVLANKANLLLKAQGSVVIDARGPGGAADGAALRIDAGGVRVTGFTLRLAASVDANTPGYGVHVTGDGVTLEKLVIVGCSSSGIRGVGSDQLVVKGCVVRACAGGVRVEGNGVRVENVVVREDGDRGVRIEGAEAYVAGCEITGIEDGYGIELIGTQVVARDNRVRNTDQAGLRADGSGTLEKNRVEGCGDDGIRVGGASFVVRDNVVAAVEDDLIDSAALHVEIEDNRVSGARSAGITLLNASSGFVRGNRVRVVADDGISLGSNTATLLIQHNRVEDVQGSAYRAGGSGHVLDGNRALRAGNDGFHVTAANCAFTGNLAEDCALDGFDLEGGAGSHELANNRARRCGGEGLDNGAPTTIALDNVFEKNRLDVAASQPFHEFAGNQYQSGGPQTLPVLE